MEQVPEVDESHFQDVQWGNETKKVRIVLERQPATDVIHEEKFSFSFSLWNANTLLVIKKVEFIRNTQHFGLLFAVNVEGTKQPIHVVIYPLKCTLSNCLMIFLTDKEVPAESRDPLSLVEEKLTSLIAEDMKSVALTLNIFGCCTAWIKSPIRILLHVLGNSSIEDRTATTHPIAVYKYYHNAAGNVLPILTATFSGNSKKLKKIAEKEIYDINQTDAHGATAVHIACIYGQGKCLQILLEHGADIEIRDKDKRTALHKACFYGNDGALRLLLQRANINAKDRRGETPLHMAVIKNNQECIEVLLKQGADVNIVDKAGWTALHFACYKNRSALCQILIDAGADVNIKDKDKNSALDVALIRGFHSCASLLYLAGGITTDDYLLQNAASQGFNECVKLLMDNQADPNLVDAETSSPLHKAAMQGHLSSVESLLEGNCDISISDEAGSTPLHLACFMGHIRIISTLLEYSAVPDIEDMKGGTSLHNACYGGHSDAVTLLLARGASVDAIDQSGATPLHLAAEKGYSACISILLKYKADISLTDSKKRSALHYAITDEEIIDLLVAAGGNINVQDYLGETPLMLATKLSMSETVRYLLSIGASYSIVNKEGKLPVDFASEKIKQIIQEETLSDNAKDGIRAIYEEVAFKFNQKPKTGIKHLLESELKTKPNDVDEDILIIIEFLHKHGAHLNRTLVGEYISEPDECSGKILMAFIEYLDFEDMEFDNALRTFLSKFRLPGEAQKIDRIMEKFAHHYFEQNEKNNIFPTEDQAYLLAFSLIMLNTDLHNPSIKHKMTCEQFVKNNTDTGLEHDLSPEFLGRMYHCIKEKEIKMENEDTAFGNSVAVKMGWMTKQGGRVKTWKRRWFILSDHVLYYFKEKQEETSKACGIVPLEDVTVREVENGKRKFCFEVSHSSDTAMKAMKRSQGQIQKGHHDSYLLCASSKQEMEEWMEAIAHNSIDNQFKALMEMKFMKAKKHQISEDLIQFPNLLTAIEQCILCKQGKEATRTKFPQVVYEPSYKNIRFCLLTFQQHRSHTIVVVGSKWNSLAELQDHSKRKANLVEYYSILQIAKHVRRSLQRHLQKDFKIRVVGHCVGAAIGSLVALLLFEKGVHISNVIGFGMPRTLSNEQVEQFTDANFPVLQVDLFADPVSRLFPGFHRIGSRLVLLKGAHYCWLENPKESEIEVELAASEISEESFREHEMEVYKDSIGDKLGLSVNVQYHLRAHYL